MAGIVDCLMLDALRGEMATNPMVCQLSNCIS
jgi:hypothetical protein